MNNYIVDLLVVAAQELNHPVHGKFAWELWQTLSSNTIPVDEAKRVYTLCGYEPFKGYPLTRLNCT